MFNETLLGFLNRGLYTLCLFFTMQKKKMKYYRKAVSFYITADPYRLANAGKTNISDKKFVREFFLLCLFHVYRIERSRIKAISRKHNVNLTSIANTHVILIQNIN